MSKKIKPEDTRAYLVEYLRALLNRVEAGEIDLLEIKMDHEFLDIVDDHIVFVTFRRSGVVNLHLRYDDKKLREAQPKVMV
jgi:hypothetical protein